MPKSLQEIEDFYIGQGLKGEALRKALEQDQEYQSLLKQRQTQIRDKHGISQQEEAKYLLPTEEDYKILAMIHELEKKNLSENDREIVKLIKTQLLDDWRSPLIDKLESLIKKYKS